MFIFSLDSVQFFSSPGFAYFPLAFSYATMITKLFVISRNETLFSRPSIHPYSRPVIHPFCHHPPEKLGFMNSYIYEYFVYFWMFISGEHLSGTGQDMAYKTCAYFMDKHFLLFSCWLWIMHWKMFWLSQIQNKKLQKG